MEQQTILSLGNEEQISFWLDELVQAIGKNDLRSAIYNLKNFYQKEAYERGIKDVGKDIPANSMKDYKKLISLSNEQQIQHWHDIFLVAIKNGAVRSVIYQMKIFYQVEAYERGIVDAKHWSSVPAP